MADCVGLGSYHFYGGHRLWHAPEDTSRTYMPDSEPVELTAVEHGFHLVQAIETHTGIQKSMQITLPGKQPASDYPTPIDQSWSLACGAGCLGNYSIETRGCGHFTAVRSLDR